MWEGRGGLERLEPTFHGCNDLGTEKQRDGPLCDKVDQEDYHSPLAVLFILSL